MCYSLFLGKLGYPNPNLKLNQHAFLILGTFMKKFLDKNPVLPRVMWYLSMSRIISGCASLMESGGSPSTLDFGYKSYTPWLIPTTTPNAFQTTTSRARAQFSSSKGNTKRSNSAPEAPRRAQRPPAGRGAPAQLASTCCRGLVPGTNSSGGCWVYGVIFACVQC